MFTFASGFHAVEMIYNYNLLLVFNGRAMLSRAKFCKRVHSSAFSLFVHGLNLQACTIAHSMLYLF